MDRREQIRKAAVNVIAEKGFYEATTQLIADEAGISVGTIYNYFRTKEEILEYIFKVECNRRINLLEALIDTDSSVEDKLRAFFEMHFEEIRKNPALSKLMVQEFRFSVKDEYSHIRDMLFQAPKLLAKIIDGSGDERDAYRTQIIGTAILGSIQALTTRFLFEEDDVTDSDVSMIIQELVALFSQRE